MRGHITKRGRDSYTIVLNLGRDPATGKRKQQWISVKGTKKEAEKRLTELIHQYDNGIFIRPEKTTLAEYLEKWLEDYARANVAPRTLEGYEHIIHRHIIPSLGKLILSQIRPEHLQKYYSEKLANGRVDGKGGSSPKTVRHHHVTLHDALQHAVKWGLLLRNPADAVDIPKVERKPITVMSANEMNAFLDVAKETPYYSLFYTALYTGMRRSELLALRWQDVDLMMCQISVTRGLHHLRDGSIVFRQPKTIKSRRMIALSPSASLILKSHRDDQHNLKSTIGITMTDEDLVFCQPDGQPYLPDTITHAWLKLVRKVGLKGVRLHDARHSHASLMLKQGVHPKIVQERLGHSSI